MKKSTILFAAILAVIVGSSFTKVNSSKAQGLDINNERKDLVFNIKNARGTSDLVYVVIDGYIVTNQVTINLTENRNVVGIPPDTGTGKNSKLAKLINDYK
ncbi:hypothetical protein [Chryseobacterium gleum]|uniref:hypothetical protein n=1 Tax=Chryseobacterium gleum TaxID=250 RepID=UPI001E4C83F8|nr:hypothetical protein [Chryseobacterium gleum]MCD9617432.1 hypothetical protein [Chryseobacterium gleum]